MYPVDNYVKIQIGRHPFLIFFSSRDPYAPLRVRQEVDSVLLVQAHASVTLWKRAAGIPFPLIGETDESKQKWGIDQGFA